MTGVPAAFALSNVNKTHMVVSAVDFHSTQFVLFTFDERYVLSTVSIRNNNKNKEIDYRAIATTRVRMVRLYRAIRFRVSQRR